MPGPICLKNPIHFGNSLIQNNLEDRVINSNGDLVNLFADYFVNVYLNTQLVPDVYCTHEKCISSNEINIV